MKTETIARANPAYPKIRVSLQIPQYLKAEASIVPSEELVTRLKMYHFVNLPAESRFGGLRGLYSLPIKVINILSARASFNRQLYRGHCSI